MKKVFALLFSVLLVATTAQAHFTRVEDGDASFEAPQTLEQPAASQVIFSYLDNNDTDVFEFEVPPALKPIMGPGGYPIGWEPIMIPLMVPVLDENGKVMMDFTQSPPQPITQPVMGPYGPVMAPLAASMFLVNAAALPPACKQYSNFYPDVALIGPGLPAPPADLPFDVSQIPQYPNAGVLMGYSDKVNEKRAIYTATDEEMNNLNERMNCGATPLEPEESLSMFLPHGLTQECLHCAPWTCDQSNAMGWYTVYAGTYQIVVFDETGRKGDYVLSQGIEEVPFDCTETIIGIDLMRAAAAGELYHQKNCVSAGESDFDGCAAPPFPY